MSLHDAIYNDKKVLEVFGIMFASFGVGALLLTITGLYGVISFSVSSRTREFGIRLALGARRIDLIRMVLRQGGRQLALGFAIGGTLAFALGKAAASAVDFITGVDPRAFGIVIVSLAVTGILALYSPARRAAGVQPLDALRHE
jgi:ABC-type antimicrobial peptide transport system permease subunit